MQPINPKCVVPDSWEVIRNPKEWPEWVQEIRQLPIRLGSLIESEGFNVVKVINPNQSTWFISCVPESEFNTMISIVGKDLNCILEIGLNTAGSFVMFKQIAKQVISVDINWDRIMSTNAFLKQFNLSENCSLIWGDSTKLETVKSVEKELKYPVDFLFIDGDHGYAQAMADYELYSPLVRSGGWIAFDDTCTVQDVSHVCNMISAKEKVNFSLIYSDGGQGIAMFQKP